MYLYTHLSYINNFISNFLLYTHLSRFIVDLCNFIIDFIQVRINKLGPSC